MEKKKNTDSKDKRKKNIFEINTGRIFLCLSDIEDRKWENYNRMFLINIVEEAIKRALLNKNICTVKFDGENGKYLEGYQKNRYPLDLEEAKNKNNFPFPDYFLMPDKKSKYYSIIGYDEDCIIENGEYNFDLFFALQFSLTNIIKGNIPEADEFLKFHLAHSFKRDLEKYKIFLDRICLKYNEFLKNKYEPLVKQFIVFQEYPNQDPESLTRQTDSDIKINWQGQSNSLTYLFRQLKNTVNENKEPLISNSYDEIAIFLKNNFLNFEKVKLSTVLGQLKKPQKPAKAVRKVVIYV
jgi:hypothetical protein